jgi:predicted dehydrogenase
MVRRKNQNERRRIRYAVVGLGYISQIAVLPAFEHARENSELTALVSSDEEKLKKLGRKYGIENTYTYEQYGSV